MIYTIEPKPTTYEGVEFRSRLEAQWACMFDLCGVKWEYEPPIDLDGWLPDFILKSRHCDVFVEVKPTPTLIPRYLDGFEDYPPISYDTDYADEGFEKAKKHWRSVHVMLLASGPADLTLGCLCDTPENAKYAWSDVNEEINMNFRSTEIIANWKTAGNRIRR